jgi:predicted ATPase
MRIDKLTLHNFKNLHDFTIDFDENSPTTVLVGRNGTGKSNLLEALTIIFRDLDLGEPPSFKYTLTYYIYRNKIKHKVEIDADPERDKDVISIKVDDEVLSYSKFIENNKDKSTRHLPNLVFGYYSGFSERMREHFDKHQNRFYTALIHNIEKPLRTLFYSEPIHSNFVLLSFFTKDTGVELNFLKKNLGIEALESVLFVMKEPPWKSKKGDARFWNAGGTVQDFLDKLYSLALAPLRRTQTVKLDFRRTTKLEHLYLYLKDAETLQQLASIYENQSEFFKALESTYISDLIKEVRPRLRVRNVDGSLTFREMSEGEQQLLMVLGLMRFYDEEESLFLLDEPDTHLNPSWSLQYLKFVRQLVGNQKTSHLIMCTHDPLLIAGLKQSQVQIMLRDEDSDQIHPEIPTEDPRGMGVAAILTSNMFGLRTALDEQTQRLLDERRKLADSANLTKAEEQRLAKLNEELAGLDFSITMRDPLYKEFVLAMNKLQSPKVKEKVSLTPQQQEDQRKLALSILSELKSKRK